MNWDQVKNHTYFKVDACDEIDLDILFQVDEKDDNSSPTSRPHSITINTKDSRFYNQMYKQAAGNFMTA